jgi:hypothetical protein
LKKHGAWSIGKKKEKREREDNFGFRISDCGFEKAWGMEHRGKGRKG